MPRPRYVFSPATIRAAVGIIAYGASFAASLAAHATIIDMKSGQHQQSHVIAPGKFLEVCTKVTNGETYSWRFESPEPLDFNIHFHDADKVVTPAQLDGVTTASSVLRVQSQHDYCWMWTNRNTGSVSVAVAISRVTNKR